MSSFGSLARKPQVRKLAGRAQRSGPSAGISSAPARLACFLQPSLRVGPTNHPLEREADRVADQMTQEASPATLARSATRSPDAIATAPQVALDAATREGRPLDAGLRNLFEPRFGASFEDVRIHEDVEAEKAVDSVGARAYTLGNHLVFGAGEYAPNTARGRHTLAHELTHVVQQAQGLHTRLARQTDPPAAVPTAGVTPTSTPSPPSVFEHNTELGGLSVGNFDFHFDRCQILIWVWVKFKFESGITADEQTAFKARFFQAIHSVWEHSGWTLSGNEACPCRTVPITIHAQETDGHYHKLVDVEKDEKREKVISDMNVWIGSDDRTLAHEFGHVLGLYDEYNGGWIENHMFWHKNRPDDPSSLMNVGTGLRERFFENFRARVQQTADVGCNYTISSPVPPVAGP